MERIFKLFNVKKDYQKYLWLRTMNTSAVGHEIDILEEHCKCPKTRNLKQRSQRKKLKPQKQATAKINKPPKKP